MPKSLTMAEIYARESIGNFLRSIGLLITRKDIRNPNAHIMGVYQELYWYLKLNETILNTSNWYKANTPKKIKKLMFRKLRFIVFQLSEIHSDCAHEKYIIHRMINGILNANFETSVFEHMVNAILYFITDDVATKKIRKNRSLPQNIH